VLIYFQHAPAYFFLYFRLQIDNSLSADKVQRACSSSGTSSFLLSTMFRISIANMYFSNAKVDAVLALSEEHHFDDETFQGGRDVITAGKHQQWQDSCEYQIFSYICIGYAALIKWEKWQTV